MVSLSVLIPTPGRPELENCLMSYLPQLGADDEVVVIGDIHDGHLPETEKLVRSFGRQFRWLEYDAGQHAWGHPQMNVGMRYARGTHLSFQDDDDVAVPGSIDVIRAAANKDPEQPLMFRFINYNGFLCWVQEGMFAENYVGGHCLVCPNNPSSLGSWSDRYAGDWDFLEQTVTLLGGPERIRWYYDVIAIGRPAPRVIEEIHRLATGVAV
jgi:hypothetical protein